MSTPENSEKAGFEPTVYSAELNEIARRRENLILPRVMQPSGEGKCWPSTNRRLFGLALSGGGIRSATFNLGLLQALAEADVLKWVDYLSTVSGGGYVGSSFSVLMKDSNSSPEKINCPFLPAEGTLPPAVKKLQKSVDYIAQDFVGRVQIFTSLLYGFFLNLINLIPLLLIVSVMMSIVCAVVYPSVDTQKDRGSMKWIPVPQDPISGSLPSHFLIVPAVALFAFPVVLLLCNRKVKTLAQHDTFSRRLAHAFIWSFLTALLMLQPVVFYWVERQNQLHGHLQMIVAVMLLPLIGVVIGAALRKRTKLGLTVLTSSLRCVVIVGFYLIFANTCNWLLFSSPPTSLPERLVPRELTRNRVWQIHKFSGAWILGCVLVLVYWKRSVNASSMHRFYHSRLRAAYLFNLTADNLARTTPPPETKLSDLNPHGKGPYHILSAALNLHGSRDPQIRRYKSDAFVFSKLFTGSIRTGFCPTPQMEAADAELELGTAMAISGAAVSPIMGSVTVGPLISLLALLNLRLAYWLPNPFAVAMGNREASMPGGLYFVKEMLAMVDDRSDYVHLSDGGHHENLGGLELLRRRCSLIIIGDSEADPDHQFTGLTRLCELAEREEIAHIAIQEQLPALDLDSDRMCKRHFVFGTIRYFKQNRTLDNEEDGLLVYLKSSLNGDEELAIKSYRRRNRSFPHEPTSQQFYADNQFECYRKLGLHIGRQLIEETKNESPFGILCCRSRENEGQLARRLYRVEDELKKLKGFRDSDLDTAYWAFDYARTGGIFAFFHNWMIPLDRAEVSELRHQAEVFRLLAFEFLEVLDQEPILDKIAKTYGEFP